MLKGALAASKISISSLILPALFAFLASLFEGASMILLIPAIKLLLGSPDAIPSLPPGIFEEWKVYLVQDTSVGVALICALTLGAVILKSVFGYFSNLITAAHTKRFAATLRTLLFERYLSFGKLFFDEQSLGYHQQVLTSYVNGISHSLSSIQGGFYAICTIAVYLVMMTSISPALTLMVCTVFPLLWLSVKWIISRIVATSIFYAESSNELGRAVSNSLSVIPLIHAYGTEKQEKEKFSFLSDKVGLLELSIDKKSLLVAPVQEIITLAFLFLLLFAATALPISTSIAEVVVFVLIVRRGAALFSVINTIRSSLASVSGPMAELLSIFDDKGKHFVKDGEEEFLGIKKCIEFRDLSFNYPSGAPAVSGVSFTVNKGETVALVGPSGSGKSTILNLIIRFYDPPMGAITADGKDIRSFTLKSWRQRLAIINQETQLFHGTIKENLEYGLSRALRDEEMLDALKKARLLEWVMSLPEGLSSQIGERGLQLSGGQRQRLSIARAFLKGAEIILLDEATSALDPKTEELIQEALSDLVRGKTTIIIAHRLATVRNADKVVVLENGIVVQEGSVRDLISSPGLFKSYWDSQSLLP